MADDQKPFHNPFGALAGLRGAETTPDLKVRDSEERAERADVRRPEPSAPGKGPARAVVRMERAGRGGKEVTVVEQLGLPARDLETWLKSFKAGLGCGGVVEGDAIVLQGDHRTRLPALLTARGVKNITIG